MNKHMDMASLFVALITLGLFMAALFTKGLTHDLFLEAGVFLVSVKIIVMAYRNNVAVDHLDEKLDTILTELTKIGKQNDTAGDGSQEQPKPRNKTGIEPANPA